ncbi:MAG: 2-hydroxyacyl-CoA dehydratase [Phycisphaeraceae bacterium]
MTGPIVFSCSYVPPEWIAAHGMTPSRRTPDRPAPDLAGGAGLCPFVRDWIDALARDPEPAGFVFTSLCDQMRRGCEWLGDTDPRPRFLLSLPATWQTPAGHRLYQAELRRLGRFLVSLGGEAPSPDRLAETMLRFGLARRALRDRRATLSARDWIEQVRTFHATGQLPPESAAPADRERGVPLALVGGELPAHHDWLYDAIAEAGGRVALEATDTGLRGLPHPYDRRAVREDPFAELAAAWFGSIEHPFRRPNTGFFQQLARDLPASGAAGAILLRTPWCDIWAAEVPRIKQWLDLPALILDLDDDPRARARGEGRVQAFLEMLA